MALHKWEIVCNSFSRTFNVLENFTVVFTSFLQVSFSIVSVTNHWLRGNLRVLIWCVFPWSRPLPLALTISLPLPLHRSLNL